MAEDHGRTIARGKIDLTREVKSLRRQHLRRHALPFERLSTLLLNRLGIRSTAQCYGVASFELSVSPTREFTWSPLSRGGRRGRLGHGRASPSGELYMRCKSWGLTRKRNRMRARNSATGSGKRWGLISAIGVILRSPARNRHSRSEHGSCRGRSSVYLRYFMSIWYFRQFLGRYRPAA